MAFKRTGRNFVIIHDYMVFGRNYTWGKLCSDKDRKSYI